MTTAVCRETDDARFPSFGTGSIMGEKSGFGNVPRNGGTVSGATRITGGAGGARRMRTVCHGGE